MAGGFAVVFTVFQIVVHMLAGPSSDVRVLLDEVATFFDDEIRGEVTQKETLRMRKKIRDLMPRAPWPLRRHLRLIERQVARLNRPGGDTGRMMWPSPEKAEDAIMTGSREAAKTRAYLDRLDRWSVKR